MLGVLEKVLKVIEKQDMRILKEKQEGFTVAVIQEILELITIDLL